METLLNLINKDYYNMENAEFFNKAEKIELENKIEKAPKTVKKAKDEFTQETYDFLHQVLVDFAIDTKHRPQLKVILQNAKAEPKNNSSI
jgi:predicted S18 family serine protease